MQWQPISTFPEDGKKYVVWSKESGIIPDVWYGWDGFRNRYGLLYLLPYYDGDRGSVEPVPSPTHWMEIDPPEQEPKNDK